MSKHQSLTWSKYSFKKKLSHEADLSNPENKASIRLLRLIDFMQSQKELVEEGGLVSYPSCPVNILGKADVAKADLTDRIVVPSRQTANEGPLALQEGGSGKGGLDGKHRSFFTGSPSCCFSEDSTGRLAVQCGEDEINGVRNW